MGQVLLEPDSLGKVLLGQYPESNPPARSCWAGCPNSVPKLCLRLRDPCRARCLNAVANPVPACEVLLDQVPKLSPACEIMLGQSQNAVTP